MLRLRGVRPDDNRDGEGEGDGTMGWRLDWRVEDDGVGVADPASASGRGNGLAGLQERLWTLGAELERGKRGIPARHGRDGAWRRR